MVLLALCLLWFLIVGGLLTHAILQYRAYRIIRPTASAPPPDAPTISVIVPARNEEHNIGRCIRALLDQDYPKVKLQVVVIDDGSEDRTPQIVRDLQQADDRLKLIRNDGLPAGWLGKPHACWRGFEESNGQWLCFIDADTTAEPPLLRTAMEAALKEQIDLLSLQPFQELGSAWERFLLPTGFFLIAFTQDLRKTSDPTYEEASVNGQFLLTRRNAYQLAGGHAAVREAVAEDSALAQLLKSKGERISVLGTEGLLRVRMYTNRRSLFEGAARQVSQLLPGARLPAFGIIALVLLGACIALPIWAAATTASQGGALGIVSLALALAASLALVGTHIGAARYFKIPFWYGLLFPVGYVLGGGVILFALRERSRRQMHWKGRVYQAATPT